MIFMCFYKCHLSFAFLCLILESKLYNMIGMNFYSVNEYKGSMNNKMLQSSLEIWRKICEF